MTDNKILLGLALLTWGWIILLGYGLIWVLTTSSIGLKFTDTIFR